MATTPTKEQVKTSMNGHDAKKDHFRHIQQLATPTDLPKESVEAVTNTVNTLIADSYALYIKYKNFHWHLASSHFRDYHLMFDEHADQILESTDVLAERVRRIGGTTIRSIGQISRLQTVQDDENDFVPAGEMIQRLLNDNRQMAKDQRQAVELTEEKKDYPTSNLLQDFLDETEKRIWFLFEIAQGGEHTA
ncbi:MAG: DNA starvation/stationary phase protection protein [Herpetosiphon sp.]